MSRPQRFLGVNFGGNPAGPGLCAWVGQHLALVGLVSHDVPPIGVAYSGGADSTALLLAAQTVWPGRVQALHVHHGLQAAADGFVEHAQAFCAQRGIGLHVAHAQARHQTGQSPEDAARVARYHALADMALAQGSRTVLLGQHAQDQVETVLLALSRGAGLPGLAAMPPVFERHGTRFGRPLLGTDAASLRTWLDATGTPYLHDPTNTDERYTRNRIRARLLPVLEQAFPAYADTIARSARHAAQAQQLLHEVAEQDLQTVGNPPAVRALQALSTARQANVLRHWLRLSWHTTPSEAQMQALLQQVVACTTRGHRIRLKVGRGYVLRQGLVLNYEPPV